MAENETVSILHEKEARAIVCVHLAESGDDHIGFNVPTDIKTDLEAWCDKCERKLDKERSWTDAMVEFADLRPCCVGCFIVIKNRMGF